MEHEPALASVVDSAPTRPGVTVLVAAHPSRLASGLLTRALNSVYAQTHQPEVIVIVNDKQRIGAGHTRQQLLDHVQTEWIAWIDSDDEWETEHLAKCLYIAEATDAVYVYSWFHGPDPLGHFGLPFNPCTPHHTTMNVLVHTAIAKEVGFPASGAPPHSNEDWAFITGVSKLACERGLKMVHLAERTWHYHQHGQNSSGLPTQGDAV